MRVLLPFTPLPGTPAAEMPAARSNADHRPAGCEVASEELRAQDAAPEELAAEELAAGQRTPGQRRPDGPATDEVDLAAAYAWPVPPTGVSVRVNFVASLDGAAATDGHSKGLSSAGDRRVFSVLRSWADVILAGAGTVRAERYRSPNPDAATRTARRSRGLAEAPTLAVVTGSGDLPEDLPCWDGPRRPLVLAGGELPAPAATNLAARGELEVLSGRRPGASEILDALARRGHRRVLCEGGPGLLATLADADAVDELCLTVAPLLVGLGPARLVEGALGAPRRFCLVQVLEEDGYLFLRLQRRPLEVR